MERPWFVGAVSAIVLALAAIAAIGSSGRLGEGSSRRVAATFDIEPMQVVAWAFLGVIGLLLLAAFSGRGGQRRQKRQRRNVSQAGVFLLLVVFAGIALTIASIGNEEGSGPRGLPGEGSFMPVAADQVVGAAGGLLAVAVLGAAAIALWLHASRQSTGTEEEAGPVKRVIDDALLELDAGGDPRAVIIRAYARLEQTFESGGMERRLEEAPQEYVGRVLEEIDIDPRAVHELTDLYEEARYSTHRMTEELADEARSVLGRIRTGITTT